MQEGGRRGGRSQSRGCTGDYEDGRGGHKPRNESGLYKLQKQENRFSLRASRGNTAVQHFDVLVP